MPAFGATLKPLGVTAFSITSSDDMEIALLAAQGLGMTGTIRAGFDRFQQPEWRMEVVDLEGIAVSATIGDVYVWDAIKLISMPQAEFDTRYDVTP